MCGLGCPTVTGKSSSPSGASRVTRSAFSAGCSADPRPANQGERLVAGRTANGVLVVAPNSLYTFSFLRSAGTRLHEVQMPESSSQFRSRDVFSQLVAVLARGDDTALGARLPDEAVALPPQRVVAYINGYGNLKTTWSKPPASSGTRPGWSPRLLPR